MALRTTMPTACGLGDSWSPGLAPTLPISGYAMVTIARRRRDPYGDLLVAHHRRVEHHLTHRLAGRLERVPRRWCRPPMPALPASSPGLLDLSVLEDEPPGDPGLKTRPVKRLPWKGVLRLVGEELRRVHRPLRLRLHQRDVRRSPGARWPPGSPNAFAARPSAGQPRGGGSARPRAPGRACAQAVSRPTTPFHALSNSTCFSSTPWGAWSVAMASMVPSARPSRTASTSRRVRRGGSCGRGCRRRPRPRHPG